MNVITAINTKNEQVKYSSSRMRTTVQNVSNIVEIKPNKAKARIIPYTSLIPKLYRVNYYALYINIIITSKYS